MRKQLKSLLDDLEQTIDSKKVVQAERLHQQALTWQTVKRLPVIASYPYPQDERYQLFPHGQVFDDPEKMLHNQLLYSFETSPYLSQTVGDDLPITVRADFGVVLVASTFGTAVQQVDDNPPWVRSDAKKVTYQDIIGACDVDVDAGWIAKAAERYRFFRDVLKEYPRLAAAARLVLPDLQGPFDNLELLRGSEVFVEMVTQQDVFLEAMDAVTRRQIALAEYFGQFTQNTLDGYSFQHGFMLKGGLLIRNDTAIMVSPQMYEDLIAPFDQRLLKTFGGGVHSCGNVEHLFDGYLSLPSMECFDFGQSEMNDVETLYRRAQAGNIALTRIAVDQDDLTTGRILKQYPTGVSLIFRAESVEQAQQTMQSYKKLQTG